MKEGIHPGYRKAQVVCACGNVIETRSTRGDFHIEICAQCHPFFTGKQKIMDTAGRIEKFRTRYQAQAGKPAPDAEARKAAPAAAPAKKEAPKDNRAAKRAKSGKTKARTEAAPAAEAPAPEAPEAKAE